MVAGPLPENEEKEILKSLKKGNLAAFERVLFAYERQIFAYIYRLVGQRQDAEDLTQETFIKIYKHVSLIDTEKKFKSWVYKIATNTVYDFWRRKKNKDEILVDDPEKFETTELGTAYYDIEQIEKKGDIEKALEQIKPVYKTVLLLFYKRGLGYKEIAEVLGQPINTVKTYIHRAKAALKEMVKDKNG